MPLCRCLLPVLASSCLLAVAAAEPQTMPPSGEASSQPGGPSVEELLPETPAALRNPWPLAMEEAFKQRRADFIAQYRGKAGVNTALENEKQGYPPTIMAFFAGDQAEAIAALQTEDADAGGMNAHTLGIDYYWCFTLKGQMRKYFLLGDHLDPTYRQRMYDAAVIWTATDPRPNTELALLTDSREAGVRAHAEAMLAKMWLDREGLRQLAAEAEQDADTLGNAAGADNMRRFASFITTHADSLGGSQPTTPEEWLRWWDTLTTGDWQVYEEYDRRLNQRPHPVHGRGTGPVGTQWDPKVRGGVVDWRNTDNLRGMREVAVYLLAEETGSELVRTVFRERLRHTARSFLTTGNGEWDSPAYLSHTASAYLNLYDFAIDPEVRLLAKAILDFITTSAAIKYFHGSFCGPNCRDYGTIDAHAGPGLMIDFFAGSGTTALENDLAHFASSHYRPPAAVVALAQKRIATPVQILATHPHYQNFLPRYQHAPLYHETTWISDSYQLGSLLEGGQGDISGCKALIARPDGGADFFIPASGESFSVVNRQRSDRFAQHRNLLLCLHQPTLSKKQSKNGDTEAVGSFQFLLPPGTKSERHGDALILQMHGTYAALRGIGVDFVHADGIQIKDKKGTSKKPGLSGTATRPGLCGYVLEFAEASGYENLAAFVTAVGEQTLMQDDLLAKGEASYTGISGHSLSLRWQGPDLVLQRDGAAVDVEAWRDLWKSSGPDGSPVSLPWHSGHLQVEAGGHRFEGRLDLASGTYSFSQELAAE